MCIAIVKPIGATVTDEALRNSEDSNPHGAGYAFVKTDKVVIKKGFFKIDDFIKSFREDEKQFGTETPFILHFRWATCGLKNVANCHPFPIAHGAMMHNGHFYSSYSDLSDSAEVADAAGVYLSKENVRAKKKELEDIFGHNKVAVLYHDKSYEILNEDLGHWDNGVWYSTKAYLSDRSPVVWTPQGGGGEYVAGGNGLHTFRRNWLEDDDGRLDDARFSDIMGY
jgi:predicted glutamine amidotransferase